jgi:hypothetical protein
MCVWGHRGVVSFPASCFFPASPDIAAEFRRTRSEKADEALAGLGNGPMPGVGSSGFRGVVRTCQRRLGAYESLMAHREQPASRSARRPG